MNEDNVHFRKIVNLLDLVSQGQSADVTVSEDKPLKLMCGYFRQYGLFPRNESCHIAMYYLQIYLQV